MSTDATRTTNVKALANTIRQLMWLGHRQMAVSMEEVGLTVPQVTVLWALEAHGGRGTMSDLVQLTQQSGGTLTGVIDRLITAGLVARERSDEDRRVVYVALTEVGRAKIEEVNQQREAMIGHITHSFSEEELAQMHGVLKHFLRNMSRMMGVGETDLT